MVFSSLTFIGIFLPLVLIAYFSFKSLKWKNAVLLIFSLVFYSWGEPVWVLAMLFTTSINYICGLLIDRSTDKRKKKIILASGVAASIAILIFFKYTGFLMDSFSGIINTNFGFEYPGLPIGISFYTFQTITYTVDVYRNNAKVQKNPAKLLLYVSMFPQLIAGPIVRYGDIAEFIENRQVTMDGFAKGMERFIIGLSKKVLLANVCAQGINNLVMADGINQMSFLGSWFGMFLFALQIYFDFSGYSDMAIGMGQFFGFRFKENFNYPYIAASVSDFWRRWHISLGSFFREYVYIPLGGNKVSKSRLVINLLLVWMLTGLWHGASWNFVLWGLYYGVFIIIEKLSGIEKVKISKIIKIPITLIIVLIGWALFYYIDLSLCITHIKAMLFIDNSGFIDGNTVFVFKENIFVIIIAVLCSIPLPKKIKDKLNGRIFIAIKAICLFGLFVLSIIYLVGQSFNPFLYFRF